LFSASSALKPATRPHYHLTYAVLLVGIASFALLQSMIIPVLPTIQHELHTTQSTVTWVMTAYLLSASICTPILGRIGDKVGKERLVVAALIVLALGSVMAALATSIQVMIIARVIQGAGASLLPLSFGIIREEFPREKVGSAIGIAASLMSVGGGLGSVFAGPIVNALSWHWLFWIPAGVTAIAAVGAKFVVPPSLVKAKGGPISIRGALLLSAWLVVLLLAVSEGSSWGWLSARTISMLVAAVVLIVAWIAVESRSADPLIDMKMMRIPGVWTANLTALLFGAGLYASMAFLPQFVQTPSSAGYGFGASVTQSGLFLLPMTVAMFIFGLGASPVAARVGPKYVVAFGAVLTAAGLSGFVFAHGSAIVVLLETTLLGAGIGLAWASMSALIVEAVPGHQVGVAAGMNANIRTIGGAVGSAAMASVVVAGASAGGLPVEAGYTHGFAMLAFVGVASLFAAFAIPASSPSKKRAALAREDVVLNGELALIAGGTLVEETV
jgi:EmrB/QacA subfamily drug resistance transporter